LVMVLTLAACTFFSTAAFASVATNIDGYKGRIGIVGGGGDVLKKGMSFDLAVASSAYNEDVSKLHVVWSVSDSSAISIKDLGYSASNYEYDAKVQLLKGGVSPTVYATVNGIELSSTFNVDADPVKATSVTLSNNAVALNGKGKTAQVSIVVGPTGVPHIDGDANPTVTSGNSHIATVSYSHLVSGEKYFIVTGVANGSTTIYVKTASGPSASCLVTVTGAGTPATITTPATTTSKPATVTSKPVTTTSKPVATTSKSTASSKPTSTASKPATSGTPISSNPENGASSSPISTASVASSASTASDSSEASTVSETSSSPTGQSKDNSVNIAAIVIVVIIVCVGAAFIILSKRKIASDNMDDTQSIDISSKGKN